MAFTRRSLQAVLDLLENKISSMEVHDRHDERAFRDLDLAREQISKLLKPEQIAAAAAANAAAYQQFAPAA